MTATGPRSQFGARNGAHDKRPGLTQMIEIADPDVPVREGVYGDRVIAMEPGGIEMIPDGDRQGRALDLSGPGCRRASSSRRSTSA